MPSIDLSGRVALVTGASRGIGRAIAEAYAQAGARVMITARHGDALNAAAAQMDGEIETFAAHAGEPEDVAACVAATVERFGAVDVLVNNAAANPYYGPAIDVDVPRWNKTMQVNLLGPLLWSQAVWHSGMAERGGSIVNVASVGGLRHGPGLGVYDMSKAGLIHQTRVLAAELGPAVRVNAIAPGLVRTAFAQVLVDTYEAEMAEHLPMRRIGEPADIAGAALYLASDLSAWTTGQVLVVDGGSLVT